MTGQKRGEKTKKGAAPPTKEWIAYRTTKEVLKDARRGEERKGTREEPRGAGLLSGSRTTDYCSSSSPKMTSNM